MKKSLKGFTLLELLIVIGILAILATTVTLVLNPAEMLKQARDSQRLGDLRSVHAAISMYAATATSTEFTSCSGCNNTGTTTSPFSAGPCTQNASTTVDGTGWASPLDLRKTSGGAALSKLPSDPSNGSTYFYAFKCDATNSTWEINGVLESAKYNDMMSKDGGNKADYYEIGSDPDLNL